MKTAEQRWAKHVEHALGKRDNGALYSALRKYGPNSFTLEVLITSDDWGMLCELEKRAIQDYKTLSPSGYNITLGGEGTQGKRSEKDRQKISAAQKKRFQNPEELKKLSEQTLRLFQDPKYKERWLKSHWSAMRRQEVREKLSIATKAQFKSEEARQLHSQRTKQAMSDPALRLRLSNIQKDLAKARLAKQTP